MVAPSSVLCERSSVDGFPGSPLTPDGYHSTQADVNAAGRLTWNYANLPAAGENDPAYDTVLTYGQPFHSYGWTVDPSFEGTRFTNDRTGHGMFVSIDGVSAF